MSKQYKLSHLPVQENKKPLTYQEELEMAKDFILVDILTFTPQEVADFIKTGVISLKEVEAAIPHNL